MSSKAFPLIFRPYGVGGLHCPLPRRGVFPSSVLA
jgi:hypothetical protein